MQRIELLKRKIKSASDLQSIVKTMKVLAAVSIRQYEQAADSISRYFKTIELGFQIILNHNPRLVNYGTSRLQEGDLAILVFGSGQPLCGRFNETLASFVNKTLQEGSYKSPKRIITVGHRIYNNLKNYGWEIDGQIEVPGSIEAVNNTVHTAVLNIEQWYTRESFDTVLMFYNRLLEKSRYDPVVQQLLPLDRKWLEQMSKEEWESRSIPIYKMSGEKLFSLLLRQYFFVSVYRAFSESLASENRSRLDAMQVAEQKIKEKLGELKQEYSIKRQSDITAEILDIIGSFEALKEEEGPEGAGI